MADRAKLTNMKRSIVPFLICMGGLAVLTAANGKTIAATINPVLLQLTTPGITQSGHSNVSGWALASYFKGNGSQITNLNASNIKSGLISHAYIPSNICRLNLPNTFTAAPVFASTPSFTVNSTSKIFNLNADSLDGFDSTSFLATTAGKLTQPIHIATGSSLQTPALKTLLTAEANDDVFMSLLTPANKVSAILFGNPNSSQDGKIAFNLDVARGLSFAVAGGITKMVINEFGNVGINTTNINNRLQVNGTIAGSLKLFLIDHPLDPRNKVLRHASIESDEIKNLYDGEIVLDSRGEAEVILPDWFEALNEKFRYSLTPIGVSMPGLFIKTKLSGNRFVVGGGVAGGEVSWQVTGVRRDAYATSNPLVVESWKPESERGTYMSPECFEKNSNPPTRKP